MRRLSLKVLVLAMTFASSAHAAGEAQSMEELRNTVVNLLEGLVKKGVLTREQAQAMVADAQAKATEQAKTQAAQAAAEKDAVRVTYVPETVREQIRNEMRPEVTADVTKEVIATAKKEGWGVPGALPDWAKNVRLYGDVRARYEVDWFAEDNIQNAYFNINAINEKGSVAAAGLSAPLNVSEDRRRLVGRLRAGLTANLGESWSLDMRLASGNAVSPVSTNQTLGNYDGRWTVFIDKAAILWNPINASLDQEFDFRIGRFANPFVSINELIWDNDVTFEGVSATYAVDLFGNDAKKMERGLFLTLGAFPLQEVELSSDDKWLYGGQVGMELTFGRDARLRTTGGYFEYDNIVGIRNPDIANDKVNDYTAPRFVQKGNTLFDIKVDPAADLYALAGRYRLANANIWLDLSFGDLHVMTGGEYVKNLGWDRAAVIEKAGSSVYQPRSVTDDLEERTEGYEIGVVVGHARPDRLGKWRTSMFYKYVERDAVLDAFTDSDFHLGGTDAKGYQMTIDVGLSKGAWLRMRYLTANEIDGPPLGIDVMQLDLNGQF